MRLSYYQIGHGDPLYPGWERKVSPEGLRALLNISQYIQPSTLVGYVARLMQGDPANLELAYQDSAVDSEKLTPEFVQGLQTRTFQGSVTVRIKRESEEGALYLCPDAGVEYLDPVVVQTMCQFLLELHTALSSGHSSLASEDAESAGVAPGTR